MLMTTIFGRTSRLPVIYVFGKKDLDIEDCAEKLLSNLQNPSEETQSILLRMDVAYAHRAGNSFRICHNGVHIANLFRRRCRI